MRNIAHIRMLNQHLVATQLKTPREIVSWMGAMQAQDYRMMRWAVAMRMKEPSVEAFRRAYDKGEIIRVHLHRGTWQLVSGEDYWWMLDLLRGRAKAVLQSWMHSNKIHISEEEHRQIGAVLKQSAGKLGSATKEQFNHALQAKGILMDDHRLSYHIRFAELDGLLCSGDLHKNKPTYALSAVKVSPHVATNRAESLERMARKYFQSHSPATLEDYAWWCGLPKADCRQGIDFLDSELDGFKQDGLTYYIHRGSRSRGYRPTSILLPSFDEYIIGYQTRYVSLEERFADRVCTKNGIFTPTIVHDSRCVGNWHPAGRKASFFLPSEEAGLDAEFSRYEAAQDAKL